MGPNPGQQLPPDFPRGPGSGLSLSPRRLSRVGQGEGAGQGCAAPSPLLPVPQEGRWTLTHLSRFPGAAKERSSRRLPSNGFPKERFRIMVFTRI